jgi:hypothetical protein
MIPGDVISFLEMCQHEEASLQRGMNFHLNGKISVILMSVRVGAPYADKIEREGRILIYEGHDITRRAAGPNPKSVDQPMKHFKGGLTQNGYFYEAALGYKSGKAEAEKVKVYEKIRSGIWVFNGLFNLTDAWLENAGKRKVFKFRLELLHDYSAKTVKDLNLEHDRLIPSSVKLEVWKRDKGICTTCGSKDNLHFDHIIPFSKGGSSLVAQNIQLLCARHNLEKRDKIK